MYQVQERKYHKKIVSTCYDKFLQGNFIHLLTKYHSTFTVKSKHDGLHKRCKAYNYLIIVNTFIQFSLAIKRLYINNI